VDLDATMVARARTKGHTVAEGDALAVLRSRPAGSLGAVVSFQVVEHLSFGALVDLLAEVRRVLVPGGILIAETVNPHAVQAFKAFWTDLTHVHPIFPEVLVCYCQEAGYEAARVVFPGGTGRLDDDRWRCGDYAVVATTAGPG
jgi:SAM-dependent methyltransferase